MRAMLVQNRLQDERGRWMRRGKSGSRARDGCENQNFLPSRSGGKPECWIEGGLWVSLRTAPAFWRRDERGRRDIRLPGQVRAGSAGARARGRSPRASKPGPFKSPPTAASCSSLPGPFLPQHRLLGLISRDDPDAQGGAGPNPPAGHFRRPGFHSTEGLQRRGARHLGLPPAAHGDAAAHWGADADGGPAAHRPHRQQNGHRGRRRRWPAHDLRRRCRLPGAPGNDSQRAFYTPSLPPSPRWTAPAGGAAVHNLTPPARPPRSRRRRDSCTTPLARAAAPSPPA